MKYWAIIGLFVVGFTFSCGNAKETMEDASVEEFKLNESSVITMGEMMLCTEELKLFIQFDSLLNDSRCPRGANCIWEGDASIQFTVTYKRAMDTLILHTNKEGEKSKSLFGYSFELENLSPYPGDDDYETAKKTATFKVTEND